MNEMIIDVFFPPSPSPSVQLDPRFRRKIVPPINREIIGTYAGIISAIFHARCVEVSLLDVVKSSYLYTNNSVPRIYRRHALHSPYLSGAHTRGPHVNARRMGEKSWWMEPFLPRRVRRIRVMQPPPPPRLLSGIATYGQTRSLHAPPFFSDNLHTRCSDK